MDLKKKCAIVICYLWKVKCYLSECLFSQYFVLNNNTSIIENQLPSGAQDGAMSFINVFYLLG